MTQQNSLTLGSLFDGIGGFPYAASFYGIQTLWASEIIPEGISVTKRHFPAMEHVGDITALHGGKLPPVDIITFGSPCQGLSIAGQRLGLADERSGLFTEAIRIIREMQEVTNGRYPQLAIWENVPGALSSDGGRDFSAVLEAFTKAEVGLPPSGRWPTAGMVRRNGVDLAWCVYDAQHFGTAQRRRRVFLVADFAARRAGEILFIPKILRWYFEAGGTPRQGASAYLEGGPGAADAGIDGYNGQITGNVAATLGVNCGMSTGRNGVLQAAANCLNPWDTQQSRVFTEDGPSPTLAGADGGGGRNPAGLVYVEVLNDQGGDNLSVEKTCVSPTLRSETHGNLPIVAGYTAAFIGGAAPSAGGVGYSEQVTPTLRGSGGSTMAPCVAIGINGDLAGPLPASYSRGTGARNGKERDVVLCAATGQSNAEILENLAPTLNCASEQPILAYGVDFQQITSKTNRTTLKPVQPALCSAGSPHVVTHPQVAGTLCGSGAGLSRPAGMASEADFCVVTAGVDCRNLRETPEISGTLQAKNQGYSLNYQNPVRMGYKVRRLTPVECERLQGYPDGWTEYGHDGKPISDTKRYQMLGNSIAVPCVAYIMQGIRDTMKGR